MKNFLTACFAVFVCLVFQISAQIPINILAQISRAEDELRFDKTLEDLMKNSDAKIRRRAALAAGRIGNENAIPALTKILEADSDIQSRATAAFALGEIESTKAADAILKELQDTKNVNEIRARAVEAAGKIAATNAKDEKAKSLGKAIIDTLQFEINRDKQQNRKVILLGLTALLRAKPEESNAVAAKFLTNSDARIRADAANTLSRLRAKNANEQFRAMLTSDIDSVAQANAARALGAAEDKEAFNTLLNAAITDQDSRVRVSAIRSLGNLKDQKAADKLLERGEKLLTEYKKSKFASPFEKNELLEIGATLGRILSGSNDERARKFLLDFSNLDKYQSAEIEIAAARIAPGRYFESKKNSEKVLKVNWQVINAKSAGIGELAKTFNTNKPTDPNENPIAQIALYIWHQLEVNELEDKTLADALTAFAAFKTNELEESLRESLKHRDVVVRAAVAGLLGDTKASKENVESLKKAFQYAVLTDKESNDAQLAILSALVKLDKTEAASSLKLALDAPDFLVRRHAAQLIKQSDLQTSFPNANEKVGTVKPYNLKTGTKLGQILNTNVDYARVVSRKNARAIVTTEKGIFSIEFFPEDAPLTVDNFINLAKAKYFDGLTIHRVVANFVMQDGDPRGDGNGGPGWQIRDEINMLEYERGAVGMALSGRDTGGSQWFVTHSPQPHLDGGYTVFGRVNETGMKIVDNLVRGDKILSVKIVEGRLPVKRGK